ncbi:AsmA-like C-terminal region-containing protein, partial [Acidobacteriia bacterium AH_259_A11_L15]|nr:AsmA-like C-terminal region-containing protein [Acidobacteriia bacterium AH_259_A11_L15]
WFARLSGRGRLRFDRVLHGALTLAPVSSPVVISNQVITCDPIQFGLYEGGGRGRLVIDLRGKEPVVDFNGLLRNVDANQLLSATSDSKDRMHGRLGGKLQVRFVGSERPQIAQSATGEGEVSLVNGRLSRFNLNQAVVAAARVAGLDFRSRETPVEDMTTQFQIADGWVRTDNLTLRTPDLTMEAVGGFSLEDELAFEAIATFTPEASRRMAGPGNVLGGLGQLLYVKDDQGRVVVPFLIRGTLDSPKILPDPGRAAQMRMGGRRRRPRSPADVLDRILRRREPPQ